MAESLMFHIADKVLGQLASAAVQEVGLALGVKKDLEGLQDTLTFVRAVLLDAEKRPNKSDELIAWLGRLREVCYEADDVFEEFEVATLQQKVIGGRVTKKVRHFFSSSNPIIFRNRMGRKIKEIREKLDKIAKDKADFHLSERDVEGAVVVRDRETYSFLDTADVFGRDKEKRDIINLLKDDNEGVQFLSIVGIGGLGKTTLVKMVYNDEKVNQQRFEYKMWVCVSDEFDLKKIIKGIITSAGSSSGQDSDLEQLQTCLRNILENRRYFLVLDDVWNDDPVKWNGLSSLLRVGASGSKIIVTTRSEKVGEIVGTMDSYFLKGLRHEECLSLFKRWAFKKGEEVQNPNLLPIGEQIVRKCKAVPLAVRTLGSLLFMKTDERDWEKVRDDDMWKLKQENDGGILPALRLSYDHLPYHLRPCFAYFSIFPKDNIFFSDEIISQWIAQGLIRPSNQGEELERIGEHYIQELLSRSFLEDLDDFPTHVSFKMHDLFHDLASLVAKSGPWTSNFQDKFVHEETRHPSFSDIGDSFPKPKKLRAFYFDRVPTEFLTEILCLSLRFKCLRVLDLRESTFEALPSSVGKLKHLKWLNLSYNNCIRSLPNSLCKLLSLQYLGVWGCYNLEKLPCDFGDLVSLRSLKLTTKESYFWKKAGFSKLTSLRFLEIYNCENIQHLYSKDARRITGLQYLSALRSLSIVSCRNLVCLPRELRNLTTLESLRVWRCKNLDLSMSDEEEGKEKDEAGGGLSSLRSLSLLYLPKLVSLPHWLIHGAAATLKCLEIGGCDNLANIKLVEELKSLQVLVIGGCPQLVSLPERMNRLNALNRIEIENCPELIERCYNETVEDWDKISHIPIILLNGVRVQH